MINDVIKTFTEYQTKMANIIAWLELNREKLAPYDDKVSYQAFSGVEINNPTRDEVVAFIKLFPGTWTKDSTGGYMCYELQVTPEVSLRLWNTELPPCCKLTKKLVTVPARTEERNVIECSPNNLPTDVVGEVENQKPSV